MGKKRGDDRTPDQHRGPKTGGTLTRGAQQQPFLVDGGAPLLLLAAQRAAIRRVRREEAQHAPVAARLRLRHQCPDKRRGSEVVAVGQASAEVMMTMLGY